VSRRLRASVTREAVFESLPAVLIFSVLFQLGNSGCYKESLLARIANDGLGSVVGFELTLRAFWCVFGVPLSLLCSFSSVTH